MLGTVKQVARAMGGGLRGRGTARVEGVSIDSRSLRPGEIFFAIRSARDGHDFVEHAVRAGACAVVVTRPPGSRPDTDVIVVDDTLEALQSLASHHRSAMPIRVIGLTGSCGKTTTKELIASALSVAGSVLATRGNLNNHLGVPLTLLELVEHHVHAVVEMGANHFGEIESLAGITDPDVGLVTCVAPAHTEFFGDLDGVARAKGELFASMRSDAIAVVNMDDPRVRSMVRRTHRAVTYGRDPSADVWLEDAREGGEGQHVTLAVDGRKLEMVLALRGGHNALNATAALAVAHAVGVDLDDATRAIASVEPAAGRGGIRKGKRLHVIDDAYNANPASVEAGLAMLASLMPGRRKVAVLGDMYELGADAGALHAAVGRAASRLGIDLVVAVGEHARDVLRGAVKGGMDGDLVVCLASTEEALDAERLRSALRPGDLVLVKGSRGMKMERIVNSLLYW
jgi:UDP-N-acetylmuramoyl-tripeptide--D-alanyl-D-alanine ligase